MTRAYSGAPWFGKSSGVSEQEKTREEPGQRWVGCGGGSRGPLAARGIQPGPPAPPASGAQLSESHQRELNTVLPGGQSEPLPLLLTGE